MTISVVTSASSGPRWGLRTYRTDSDIKRKISFRMGISQLNLKHRLHRLVIETIRFIHYQAAARAHHLCTITSPWLGRRIVEPDEYPHPAFAAARFQAAAYDRPLSLASRTAFRSGQVKRHQARQYGPDAGNPVRNRSPGDVCRDHLSPIISDRYLIHARRSVQPQIRDRRWLRSCRAIDRLNTAPQRARIRRKSR